MVVDAEVKASKDVVPVNDDATEVTPSVDYLVVDLETMNDTLFSQDKL